MLAPFDSIAFTSGAISGSSHGGTMTNHAIDAGVRELWNAAVASPLGQSIFALN
jgi:hypothetical protein